MKRPHRERILRPVHPNAGIRAAYRKRLLALLDEMESSYLWWIRAAYRKQKPAMAKDSAADNLERQLRRLGKQWRSRFEEMADSLAKFFAKSTLNRSDATLRAIMKNAGWTVDFHLTPALRDILKATVTENVSLIKSIHSEFHTQVEGMVMRSVTAGRDLATLTKELEHRFSMTRRRAELISRDQNNKATSAYTRARYIEHGITEAIWIHSGGGKTQRPTHVKNSGKRYDVSKGWFDPAVGEYIFPGQLINCRCVARPVVKGFS